MLSESFLSAPLPRLLEVHEVAYHLRCSQEQVRRLIRAKKLTAIRFGPRSWRVDPRDFQAFIDARRERAVLEQAIGHAEREIDRRLESAADRLRTLRTPA
jgi:excisionase family DNA binding protein